MVFTPILMFPRRHKGNRGMYLPPLCYSSRVSFCLSPTNQKTLRSGVLFALLLMVASQVVNNYIKSSLHISLNIVLCFLILPINAVLSLTYFGFVIVIAWSRLALKRHTIIEIYAGAILGLIAGVCFFYFR